MMKPLLSTLLVSIFAVLLLSSGAAFAQSNLAVIDSRIAQLEAEIRRLTGRIEEQNHKIRQLQNDVERRVSDAELRIEDLEKKSFSASNRTSPQTPVIVSGVHADKSAKQPSSGGYNLGQISSGAGDNATLEYEEAFATLRNGNYDLAEQQFQAFLNAHTDHSLSNNAKYWLAETYYVRNQYDAAAKGFANAYQTAPKGPKAPDNLLKLGLSLAGMGKSGDACVALGQLLGEYKSGPRSVLSRAEVESTRLGCSS